MQDMRGDLDVPNKRCAIPALSAVVLPCSVDEDFKFCNMDQEYS